MEECDVSKSRVLRSGNQSSQIRNLDKMVSISTFMLVLNAVLVRAMEDAEARRLAKPWYMRNIEITPDIRLPFTPVTVAVLFFSVFYLFYFWNGRPNYVEASHILLGPKDEDAEEKLEEWKEKIGKDRNVFSKYARKHSECPSGKNGGFLGRFKRYDMAPPFDRTCFDPKTPVKQVVGPIQTQFGWHLIYIHDRQLPE